MKPVSYGTVLFILVKFMNYVLVVPAGASLEPKGPPRLINMPITDLDYKEGETMKISCDMTSRPRPIQYWYKSGRQMWPHHNPRYNITRTMLVISQLHLNDSGEYSCRGINQYGSKEVIFTLNVRPKDKARKADQQMTIVPSNMSATLGQSVRLECSLILDQDTPEHVSWVKRDSLNQSVTNDTIIQTSVSNTDESPVLHLSNLTKENEGLYTCIIISVGVEHCHTWLWVTSEPVETSIIYPGLQKNTMLAVYVVIPVVTLVGIVAAGILIYCKWKSTRLSHQGVTYFTVEKSSDSTHDLVT
ncbi:fibroblast growth factor receptor 1-like [Mizuhopecten yessoensis]|uniref:fibroblast growth factor receptor 1-like n=1 Tax=Mizuhopecten yessoensis TaxID=6573 RepID=UPI000B45A91C|nr:fibroblast growth factor receptor 1-like [Mizuhopecten yessoensis]XP_021361253.1 fibroblast growth factor receptor 1-like [Mizuhopecten yessoensis]